MLLRLFVAAVALFAALGAAPCAFAQGTRFGYSGMAEASAAALLDPDHFVVAEDECNTLLVYKRGQRIPVGSPVVLADFLGTEKKASDLEGAARVGDVIYWISSHSRTKGGEERAWRHRFFATSVEATSPPSIKPVGTPFTGLIPAMIADPKLDSLKPDAAAKRPPEAHDGLNIEGLAAWKDAGVLIAFRNPLRDGDRAVLVPLENPGAVIKAEAPKFGKPILLDLDKRGVRSIDRAGDHYLIVAGPIADDGKFALYRWSGKEGDRPTLLAVPLPPSMSPEALVVLPGGTDVMLLSDDGVDDGIKCGSPGKATQKFRSLTIKVP